MPQRLWGVVHGGGRYETDANMAYYVRLALVDMPGVIGPVQEETVVPILYVMGGRILMTSSPCTMILVHGSCLPSSQQIYAKWRCSCRRQGPTAA